MNYSMFLTVYWHIILRFGFRAVTACLHDAVI